MRVHREKFETARRLLREGESQRKVAKITGLQLGVVNEIGKQEQLYVDLEERKRELQSIRNRAEEEAREAVDRAETLKRTKEAEINFYNNLTQEIAKADSVRRSFNAEIVEQQNEIVSLGTRKAQLLSSIASLRGEAASLQQYIQELNGIAAQRKEEIDRLDKVKRTSKSDTSSALQKFMRISTHNTLLSSISDMNLETLAGRLTFADIWKLMNTAARRDPMGYWMWVLKTFPLKTTAQILLALREKQGENNAKKAT